MGYDYRRFIEEHEGQTATRYCQADIKQLGLLAILDVMTWLSWRWTRSISHIQEFRPEAKFKARPEDGLPQREDCSALSRRFYTKTEMILRELGIFSDQDTKTRDKSPVILTELEQDGSDTLKHLAQNLLAQALYIQESEDILKAEQAAYFLFKSIEAAVRESHSATRLARLATIFLPLTLTAGILSMEKRLRDVDLILLDFLTLAIDMGLVVYMCFWFSNLSVKQVLDFFRNSSLGHYDSLQEIGSIHRWVVVKCLGSRRIFNSVYFILDNGKVLFWLAIPLGIAILVTINIGLFGFSETGWKAMEWGTAGTGGFLVLGFFVKCLLSYFG
ncbi:MAG: hypothetical protein LQ351_003392 [Letrouitia transgressa]|nr:MAG: hypothetical protein LQ351_003392 [Letrouitia transgressa]